MATKSSVFVKPGCRLGFSLGSQAATDWPSSYMYWGTQAAGWTGTQLQRWNKIAALLTRNPDCTRVYWTLSDITTTTGTAGSAGNYGAILTDHRAIMNTGAFIVFSFTLGGAWTTVTNGSHNADLDKLIQNIKRWYDDSGNTANPRKIILCFHHEPSNDKSLGTANDFVQAFRYIVGYFSDKNVGPGKAYDCVEWAFIDIGTTYGQAGGNPYYPGDAYVTWAFADPYNWGGGLGHAIVANGHIPTIGDDLGSKSSDVDRYNSAWKTMRDLCQSLLNWSDSHPTINIGLAEWGCSPDIDRYTVDGSTFVLKSPKTHTGDPNLMTEWVLQSLRGFKGLASAAGTTAPNAFTADPRMTRLKIVIYWNSQAKMPRWFNQMPIASGASTAGTSLPAGIHQNDILNAFITMASDPYFTSGTTTGPKVTSISAAPDDEVADRANYTIGVQAGSSTEVNYSIDFGDGTNPVTGVVSLDGSGAGTITGFHDYPHDDTWRIIVTLTDGNSLTDENFADVQVSGGTGAPEVEPITGQPYWKAGSEDFVLLGRERLNDLLDVVAKVASRWDERLLRGDSANWTAPPSTVQQYQQPATTAAKAWPADLRNNSKIKFTATIQIAPPANMGLALAYSINSGTTWRCFDSATAPGTAITVGSAGPLTGAVLITNAIGPFISAECDIPPEARIAGVWITVFGWGGDGSTNLQPNHLSYQVRY